MNQFVPEQDPPEAGLDKSKRLQETGMAPSSSLRLAARAECPVPQAAASPMSMSNCLTSFGRSGQTAIAPMPAKAKVEGSGTADAG